MVKAPSGSDSKPNSRHLGQLAKVMPEPTCFFIYSTQRGVAFHSGVQPNPCEVGVPEK